MPSPYRSLVVAVGGVFIVYRRMRQRKAKIWSFGKSARNTQRGSFWQTKGKIISSARRLPRFNESVVEIFWVNDATLFFCDDYGSFAEI